MKAERADAVVPRQLRLPLDRVDVAQVVEAEVTG